MKKRNAHALEFSRNIFKTVCYFIFTESTGIPVPVEVLFRGRVSRIEKSFSKLEE
jgi:hypothetical protein